MPDDYPWAPCTKPCRFLVHRVYDSGTTGLPAGTEERCFYSTNNDIALLLSLARKLVANTITGDYIKLSDPDSKIKMIIITMETVLLRLREDDPSYTLSVKRGGYFTKTGKEAARDHISTQLGDFNDSRLAEWLTLPAEKEEG